MEETSKRLSRLGELRELPIGELTTETLTQWQSKLLDRLAPRTVVGTRTSINQPLNWAVELGVIGVNPIAKVRPPKVATRPGNVLAPDDVGRLLEAPSVGFSWDDIDVENGTAAVRRCVMYSSNTGKSFGPPTTVGALGPHFLAPCTVEKLRTWRARQAAERLIAGSCGRSISTRVAPSSQCSPRPAGSSSAVNISTHCCAEWVQRSGLMSLTLARTPAGDR